MNKVIVTGIWLSDARVKAIIGGTIQALPADIRIERYRRKNAKKDKTLRLGWCDVINTPNNSSATATAEISAVV